MSHCPTPNTPHSDRSPARPPRTRLAVAVRAVALGLSMAATLPATVHAQQAGATQSAQRLAVDSAAGPLDTALNRLARLAGVSLSFDPALVENRTAPAVKGSLTFEEAIGDLLQGSGLEAAPKAGGGYQVQKATGPQDTRLRTVNVEHTASAGTAGSAYRVKDASVGALGNKPLKDTPYSIAVFSRDLIDNLQARSLSDLLKGDASVGLMPNNLNTENNSLSIRGLAPDSLTGSKIDGLNVQLSAKDLPFEHLERVELLKGASGFLYGFGAPGGTINYVLKRAGDAPVTSIGMQLMDSGLALIHGDIGSRFGEQDRFGYRLNLVHESGDTYIDDGESKRSSGSLALDWRITPELVWRADALVGKHIREGGYFGVIPNATGLVTGAYAEPLKPIDGDQRLAPSSSRYGSRIRTYGTDVSWDFAPDWNFALAYRFAENGRQFALPNIYANADGDYSLRTWNYANGFESEQFQGMISGRFETGIIGHDVVLGASNTETENFWSEDEYLVDTVARAGNLSDPIDYDNPFGYYVSFDAADAYISDIVRKEVFASDTLHVGDDWDVIIGLRHGRLNNKTDSYDKSAITPTAAVLYRPTAAVSLYTSYVEAFEEGTIVFASDADEEAGKASKVFDPMKSKQYEIGAKAEGDDWSTTAAIFRIERALVYRNDNVVTQDGEARYQGVELSGKMRLAEQWLVLASAMWLDATSEKTDVEAMNGEAVQGVAREQLSLYGEYSVAGLPLTLSAGTRYVGKRPVDQLDEFHVDSVALFDAGARYETELGGKTTIFRLNVDNIADKAYWITTPLSRSLQQGAPRTVKLGAQINF